MAVLHQIWIKRAHRGPMDAAVRATLVPGRGIAGNADQGGRRQVTLIDLERWRELMDRLGADQETGARRANLVIDSLDLFDSRGKTLRIITSSPSVVRWSVDNWGSFQDSECADSGLGLWYVDLPIAQMPPGKVDFTIRWKEKWEVSDFAITIL